MNKLFSTISALTVASVTALFAPLSGAQEVKGDAAAGQKKVAMCIGCHGIPNYQTAFPEVYRVPKISGQSASYLQAALKEYKEGARKFGSMQGIAASLSEQDMADIAAYYSQQAPVKAPATRIGNSTA